jgi:hypothetical protein
MVRIEVERGATPRRRITILSSTGSVGCNTIDILPVGPKPVPSGADRQRSITS